MFLTEEFLKMPLLPRGLVVMPINPSGPGGCPSFRNLQSSPILNSVTQACLSLSQQPQPLILLENHIYADDCLEPSWNPALLKGLWRVATGVLSRIAMDSYTDDHLHALLEFSTLLTTTCRHGPHYPLNIHKWERPKNKV